MFMLLLSSALCDVIHENSMIFKKSIIFFVCEKIDFLQYFDDLSSFKGL
jgi:hypothetical protein